MKFLLITIILLQSCAPKSQIIGGKICRFCFSDNPSWRSTYCNECLTWDKKGLTRNDDDAILVSY